MKTSNLKKNIKPFYTLLFLLICNVFTFKAQLSGNYTIGGVAPDYTTIQGAINDLNSQGVNGVTTFNLRNGFYTEQLNISNISGTSDVNRIIFQSENQDSTSVTIQFEGSSSVTDFVIDINGGTFLEFSKLTIRRISPNNYSSKVFNIQGGSNSIEIANCILDGGYSSFSAIINSPNSLDNNLWIHHNVIQNGKLGIYLEGPDALNLEFANRIEDNIIDNVNLGLEMRYQDSLAIVSNYINCLGVTNTEYSVKLIHCDSTLNYSKNSCYNPLNGCTFNYCEPISNGSIQFHSNFFSSRTLVFFEVDGVDFFNNTVHTEVPNTTLVKLRSNTSFFSYNNIFSNFGGSYSLEIQSSVSYYGDYNNYYSTGNLLKIGTSTKPTLNDWQLVSGSYDQNTISVDPNYVSSTDYHIYSNYSLYNSGINKGVMEDIDGEIRLPFPCIGGDEFTLPPSDATSINMPLDTVICPNITDVPFSFINTGSNNLTTLNIDYLVNGTPQSSFSWSGNILPGDTVVLNSIGSFNFLPNSNYIFNIWTSYPNGTPDLLTRADTVSYLCKTKMKGDYIIDLNGSGDFTSFNEAVDSLVSRGICDTVYMKIKAGEYEELVEIPNILGTESIGNWVVWESFDQHQDSVKLYSFTYDSDRELFVQSQRQHFKNLTIQRRYSTANSGGSLDRVIEIRESNVIIENCLLEPAYWFYQPNQFFDPGKKIVFIVGQKNNITLRNNRFMYGLAGVDVNYIDNITIEGNFFFNTEGVAGLSYCDTINLINNQAIRDTILYPIDTTGLSINNSGSCFGIAESSFSNIIGNEIFGNYNSFLGMESSSNLTTKNKIINNMVSIGSHHAGSHPISIYGSDYTDIHHNSINLFAVQNTSSFVNGCLYIYPNQDFSIANNIFSCSDCDYIYRFTSGYPTFDLLDYNVYNYDTLSSTNVSNSIPALLQFGLDSNSFQMDPNFISISDLHIQNYNLANAGLNIGVTKDFDGEIRTSNPSIGADELFLFPFNISLNSVNYEVVNCDSTVISFNVSNVGTDTITYFKSLFYFNNILKDSTEWNGSLFPNSSTTSLYKNIGSYPDSINDFRVVINSPNNATDSYLNNNSDSIIIQYSIPHFILPDTIICNYDSVMYQVPYYDSILWSNGGALITSYAIDTGLIDITVINDYGCKFKDTALVEHFPTPLFYVYLQNDTLFSSELIGNIWYGNGSHLIQHNFDPYIIPDSNVTYYSQVTDSNGCKIRSNTFVYSGLLIPEFNEKNAFDIYPNPTNNIFNIKTIIDDYTLSVYDQMGEIILRKKCHNNETLDISNLPGGVYIVSFIVDGGSIYTTRLVKMNP